MNNTQTKQQILNYLTCYLIRWDEAVQKDESLEYLKDEFKNFCEYNYLPFMSADELMKFVKENLI